MNLTRFRITPDGKERVGVEDPNYTYYVHGGQRRQAFSAINFWKEFGDCVTWIDPRTVESKIIEWFARRGITVMQILSGSEELMLYDVELGSFYHDKGFRTFRVNADYIGESLLDEIGHQLSDFITKKIIQETPKNDVQIGNLLFSWNSLLYDIRGTYIKELNRMESK